MKLVALGTIIQKMLPYCFASSGIAKYANTMGPFVWWLVGVCVLYAWNTFLGSFSETFAWWSVHCICFCGASILLLVRAWSVRNRNYRVWSENDMPIGTGTSDLYGPDDFLRIQGVFCKVTFFHNFFYFFDKSFTKLTIF